MDVDLRLRRLNSKGPFGREARFIRKLFVVSDLLCAWPCVLPSHALTWNLGAGAWKMRVVLTQIGRTLSAPPKTVPAAPFLHVLQGPSGTLFFKTNGTWVVSENSVKRKIVHSYYVGMCQNSPPPKKNINKIT